MAQAQRGNIRRMPAADPFDLQRLSAVVTQYQRERIDRQFEQVRGWLLAMMPHDTEARLYRQATSDLALARRDYPRDRVTSYLNRLVSQAYATVYSTAGISWREVARWFAVGFPRLFRATAGYYLLSVLLFFGSFILSYVAVTSYPRAGQVLLPSRDYQAVSSAGEQGKLWTEIPVEQRSFEAAFIMTNNIKVAILAFGGGMLLGLGTVLVLLYNGLQLGAVFGVVANYGLGWNLLSFASGHGAIELSVICLAGGAGLMLADAIARPGLLTRGEALRLAAMRAVQLCLGGAALLVIAGTIEGFFSPSHLPHWLHYAVGIVTGVLLYAYWICAGRKEPGEAGAEA